MKDAFEFSTYKDFLQFQLKTQPRGMLSRLAEAAECQRPYLSKVLQVDSAVHLTPDHMHGICVYLGLADNETEYLSLLLERDRAASVKYRNHLKARIQTLKTQHLNLKKQIGKEELKDFSDSPSSLYYSYWLYSALHIAVSIPSLQTVAALSKKFSLPAPHILVHLEILEKMELIKRQKERWHWLTGDLHLPAKSPWIAIHHANWRNQATQEVRLDSEVSLHYSVVQSLSSDDLEKLRLRMFQWIKEFSKVASPSQPEELICFNIDFFKVGSS